MIRMFLRSLALLSLLLASPAFALDYQPEIWPLRDGLIPAFDMAGKVEVVNVQPSKDTVVVYKYAFTAMKTDYNAVTEVMTRQIREEIAKNGRAVDGPDKRVEIRVVHLLSKYKFFYWNSNIRYEVRLGNGVTIEKDVPHGSGNPLQDLNGCIAEGVMVLLNDPQVREYLSQGGAGTAPAPVAPDAGTPAAAPTTTQDVH